MLTASQLGGCLLFLSVNNRLVIWLSKQQNLSTPKLLLGITVPLRTCQIAIVVFKWKPFSCVFEVEKVFRREQVTPCLALI